jgi:signal transduction histidine kinase
MAQARVSIRRKVTVLTFALAMSIILVSFGVFYFFSFQNAKDDLMNRSVSSLQMVAQNVTASVEFEDADQARLVLSSLKNLPELTHAVVFREQKVFSQYQPLRSENYVFKAPAQLVAETQIAQDGDFYLISVPVMKDRTIVGQVVGRISTEQLNEQIRQIILILMGLLLVIMLIAFIAANVLNRQISKPIVELAEITEKVAHENDYTIRAQRTSNDEIGDLVEGFNFMLNRVDEQTTALQQAMTDLRNAQQQIVLNEKMAALGQLIAGVAHEINTPIGSIKASIGTISDAMKESMVQLPKLLGTLSETEQNLFYRLLETSLESVPLDSSREERKAKKELTQQLEAAQIANADRIADRLVDMAVFRFVEPYYPLFRKENALEIIRACDELSVQHRSSENIKIAVDKVSKIVFALKNYARFDTTANNEEKRKASVVEGMVNVLTLYHNLLKKGIEVYRFFEPNIPEIYCYPDELNQVWTNLIHNAIQAMNHQGRLDIFITTEDGQIVVKIRDYGPGIPPEIRDRIFEPFFTTKPAGEGSGLGLDIVRKIVDKHEGKITLSSEPGNTTFGIYLPIITD